jgi:hypothetical protein
MKKIYALLISSLILMNNFYADSGIYLGATASINYLNGKHSFGTPNGDGESPVKSIGFAPSISAGYISFSSNQTYFGGEISYTFKNHKKDAALTPKDLAQEGKAGISHKSTMQAKGYFGIMLNPRVGVHALLAFERGSINIDYKGLTFGTSSTEKYKKKYKTIIPGLGAIYRFNKSLFASVNYNFVPYKKIEIRKIDETINGAKRAYSYKPSEHRLLLTISYKF